MQEIVIPNTCLRSSRLGLGTASLHHLFSSRKRREFLKVALDSGFTHFDTSPMYGEGLAERELGRFLGSERNRVTVATKIGFPAIPILESFPPLLYAHRTLGKIGRNIWPNVWNYRPRSLTIGDVEESLQRSMNALRTDWIDLLLIHEPCVADVDALLKLAIWLEKQRTSGRVRYIGLAGCASSCINVVRHFPDLFNILQVEDSLSKYEANIVVESGWPLQITFGYLRNAIGTHYGVDGSTVIKAALERNTKGVILISTRNLYRLKLLASVVDNISINQ